MLRIFFPPPQRLCTGLTLFPFGVVSLLRPLVSSTDVALTAMITLLDRIALIIMYYVVLNIFISTRP
jgi:hypothetical protein